MNPTRIYISHDPDAFDEWWRAGKNETRPYIENLIVHCSATPKGMLVSAADIRRWHMEDNGWSDIGYHYVVRPDGLVEKGRLDHVRGAHVAGHNRGSIGICLVGMGGGYPSAQIQALKDLLKRLKFLHGIADNKNIRGHYELDPGKTCPDLEGDYIRGLVK